MRIGILTLPLHTNYGGILQAYALQTVLERMGHEVCLIEKRRKPLRLPLWKTPLSYGKRILKNLTGHPFPIFYEQKINREDITIRQNTDKFINKYIKQRMVDDFSEIKKTDFDVIVVGSDQIWRPKYFHEIEHAFLDFTEGWNIKRIAYAASFGTDIWEYTNVQTDHCKKFVKCFDDVSVREKSGVDLCREHLAVRAEHVLDPTMLLQKDDYIRLFENTNTPKSEGTLLNYILDETPEKVALINMIAKGKRLQPFRVNAVKDINQPIEKRIAPSVEQWLHGFYDAEFVVTDSFHACVFSILFNKPFVAIGNAGRGISRFTTLLTLFGLKDRLIIDISEYSGNVSINWNKVNSLLNEYRRYSLDYLSECLNK